MIKVYENYKDSGVEWVQHIPKHWGVKRFRFAFNQIKNGSTINQIDYDTDTLPITRIETISTGFINKDKVGYVQFVKELSNYKLDFGDILFSHINSLPMVGNVAQYLSNEPLYHGMNLLRLVTSKNENMRYIFWTLKSSYIRQQVESVAKPAINQASVSVDNLKSLNIFSVPIHEQQQIAEYLDQQTAKIDELVQKQNKLIELLQEKKKSLINHVVTKGLNKNAQMKDSGVEWLGQIPAHWKLTAISHVFVENKQKNKRNINTNLLSLSYGNIIRKSYESNFGLLPESFETYQILDFGYIILRLTDLQNDQKSLRCGFVYEKGIITSAYIGLISASKAISDSKYFYYLLHLFDIKKGFYGMGAGVRQSLSYDELKRLIICIPNNTEQHQIAEYLDDQTAKIDELINKAKSMVELLKEHKQSLINSVVTGKIKVIDEDAI